MEEYAQSEIIKKIKSQTIGPLFGIMTNEVTNSSNVEQLGLVLRYTKDTTLAEYSKNVWDVRVLEVSEYVTKL